MRKRVQVLKKDIKKGAIGCPFGCPVALALRRTFFEPEEIIGSLELGVGAVSLNLRGTKLDHSQKVRKFIEDFDFGKKVKPFNFYLEVPHALLP